MFEQLGISSRRQLSRVLSDGYGPTVPPASPERCPYDSISYALSAAGSQVFAGLADARIHRTPDGGDTWARADAIAAVYGGG